MADNMQDKLISVLLVVLISTMLAASVIGAYIASRLTVSPSDVYAEVKGLREELHSENGWKRIALLSYAKDKDAVAAVDASGVIVAWSRGAEEMFGVSAEQTVGGGILFAIIPELRDEHIESFRRAMTQPGRRPPARCSRPRRSPRAAWPRRSGASSDRRAWCSRTRR